MCDTLWIASFSTTPEFPDPVTIDILSASVSDLLLSLELVYIEMGFCITSQLAKFPDSLSIFAKPVKNEKFFLEMEHLEFFPNIIFLAVGALFFVISQ